MAQSPNGDAMIAEVIGQEEQEKYFDMESYRELCP